MSKKLFSVVIPCLNEQKTILEAVNSAKRYSKKYFGSNYEIIVSDNGSTDNTLEILKKVKNINLINVPIKGYGAALHWGIMNATGDYVMFADADMSYPFENIKLFARSISLYPDLVLGSRIKGKISKGAMPFLHRYLGTPILTFLIRVLYKIPTTDCNSGMRMVKRSFYKRLNMRNSGMEWASELLAKTAIKKGVYVEMPINYKKDKRGRKPHLSSWSDGWRHLKAIFLIKPEGLNPLVFLFGILGAFLYKKNFGLSFLFFEVTFVLILGLMTLNLLGSIIEKKDTAISKFLREFHLVPLTGVFALLVVVFIFFIPDYRLGMKLFFVSMLGILLMWVFLVETIKTHLANRLPDLH